MKISKKVLVGFAVLFFVGFAGGMLTEHVIHNLQAKSAHHPTEEHGHHTHEEGIGTSCPLNGC